MAVHIIIFKLAQANKETKMATAFHQAIKQADFFRGTTSLMAK